MKLARLTMGGLAAAVGVCALSSAGFAQEYYVRTTEPIDGPVIVEEPGYRVAPAPRERVIIREAPIVLREAPPRVIVRDPMGGPYADDVYVREPAPLPPRNIRQREVRGGGFYDDGCQPVQRETRSGMVTVGMACD